MGNIGWVNKFIEFFFLFYSYFLIIPFVGLVSLSFVWVEEGTFPLASGGLFLPFFYVSSLSFDSFELVLSRGRFWSSIDCFSHVEMEAVTLPSQI